MRMSLVRHWARRLRGDRLPLRRGLCSSSWLSKSEESSKEKVWYSPNVEVEKQSWNAPKLRSQNQVPTNEWQGLFHQFMPEKGHAMDIVSYLQRGIDLRPSSVRRWWSSLQREAAGKDQMFNPQRVATLGFELAAAHFIVHRGGKVRFRGAQEWVQQDEDGLYDLARNFQPGVYMEEIDARGVNLVYEGLESMKNLHCLKGLNVANSPNIDDWCIDRICSEFSGSLEHLDLSGCTQVTDRGVAALARLRCLQTLNLEGLDSIRDIKLLCLLLEDELPEIKILGIDYMNPQALEHS